MNKELVCESCKTLIENEADIYASVGEVGNESYFYCSEKCYLYDLTPAEREEHYAEEFENN